MDAPAKPASRTLGDVVAAVAWVLANLLLMRCVGHWLTWTGGAGVILGAMVLLAGLTGRTGLRRTLSNLLLALTVANFNGWAFSHVANLPFYLGLFFFMLFGLVLGAAIFRLLAAFGSLSRRSSWRVAIFFIALPWLGGLALEAQYFPTDVYDACVERHRLRRPSGAQDENPLKQDIPQQARTFLREQYGSVLTLSYLRWAVQDGSLEIHLHDLNKSLTYELRQRPLGLVIRLAASLLLLGYGVFSQVGKLSRASEKAKSGSVSDDSSRPSGTSLHEGIGSPP